ncbi:hypothetical protein [Mesorhizobium sp. M0091]|uniref:hypothetical protein n=1 Tax=Mesorhizobium sp. M0091 TaxID=2956875 RepID=UPI0033380FA0
MAFADYGTFTGILSAIAGLGTAAFGLVDSTKVYRGGVSNIGFGFVRDVVTPYKPALALVNAEDPLAIVRANWLNGMAKADQKATVKSLIRLGLTAKTVADLGKAAPGVDVAALTAASAKIDSGQALDEVDINVLGRFDAIVDAQMDTGFERADQQYRNAAKVLAAIFAVILAVVGGALLYDGLHTNTVIASVLIGLVSVPLAPISKDLATALGTAVSALKAAKG